MLTQWLPTSPSPLPRQRIRSHSIWCISDSNLRYAFTQVGVGGIVLNSKVGCLDVLIDELIDVFRILLWYFRLTVNHGGCRQQSVTRLKSWWFKSESPHCHNFRAVTCLQFFSELNEPIFIFFMFFFMLAMFCWWFGDVKCGKFKVGSSQAEKWIAPSAEISWDICESWVVSPVQVAWQIRVKISPLGGVHPVLS